MFCKKCGYEIKDNENFCTNCGTSVNESASTNKKAIKIKLKTVIILLSITLILVIVSFVMSIKKNGNQKYITDRNSAQKTENEDLYNNSSQNITGISDWQVNENGEITNGKLTLHIGDYINYNEQIGATKMTYTSDVSLYDGLDGQLFTLSEYKYGWRLLGVEDGQLLLISEDIIGPDKGYKNTSKNIEDYGRMYLFYTSWGYANIINDLNSISKLYGQGYGASNARSITIEDINKITGFNASSYTGSNYKYYPETLTSNYKDEKKGLSEDSIEYELLFKNNKTNSEVSEKYKGSINGCKYWLANEYKGVEYTLNVDGINCVFDGHVSGIPLFSSSNNANSGVGIQKDLGVRPIIYLNKYVELIKCDDGSYDIKGSTKKIIYNEAHSETFDDTAHLLEEIYTKYPELEGKDGIVCSRTYGGYTDYWLLDEIGKKMYFTNIEGFEAQLPNCPSAQEILNRQTNSNSQESQSHQAEDGNSNIDKPENKTIEIVTISIDKLSGKSEEDISRELESKGLVAKYIRDTKQVPYIDEKAGKTFYNIERQIDSEVNAYQKGDTVEVFAITYQGTDFTVSLNLYNMLYGYDFDYKNGKIEVCKYKNKKFYSYIQNPENMEKNDLELYCPTGRGVKVYINNEYVGDTSKTLKYNFNKIKTFTLKLVAPYVYDMESQKNVDNNITIYEKEYSVLDIYNNKNSYDEYEF